MKSTVKDIASKFGIRTTTVAPAGQSGFSGARVWQITADDGQQYSVKQLTNTPPDHLAWIHRVMSHTLICDCDFIPAPQRTQDGMSFHQTPDGLWEVCRWVPGAADFCENPSDDRLSHAAMCLAKFHQAAAQVNFDFRPSDGVKTRLNQLLQLQDFITPLQITAQSTKDTFPALGGLLFQLKQLTTQQIQPLINALSHFSKQTLPVQPVIRDLWHDHLLFTGEKLTGIVDFDAMQMDTIALDLTRCLGSIIPDQPDRWKSALEQYHSVRPIQPAELELIGVIDPINVILSSMNWLKWIVVEQRHFENPAHVQTRLQFLNERLSK
jgi:homoserine kinase type II